jgi:tetraacyldisaccharide-1-P 4'-kinase
LVVRDRSGAESAQTLDWLGDRRVLAVCGIGNGEAFVESAREVCDSRLVGSIALADHAVYDAATVARINNAAKACRADCLLTTRKDDVKMAALGAAVWGVPVATADLALQWERGESEVRTRVLSVAAGGRRVP